MQVTEKSDMEWHEKFAKASFNKTWDLMEKEDRNADEDIEMIHTAHSSRYHWGILVANGSGTPLNLQRGEWQISRVYALLKRGEPALYHANKCLKITQENNIEDFDLAFAYESIARASALIGNEKDYKTYYNLAEDAGKKIKKKEDRDHFFQEFKGGVWS